MIYIKTTKQVLAESMIQLLEMGQDLERIGVEDIVKNCQLSRRTFYNHFADKKELIGWIFEHEDQIFENDPWEEQIDFGKVLLNQLNLIKDHSNFYLKMFNVAEAKTLFYNEIRRRLMLWLGYNEDENLKTRFFLDFFSHGYTEAVVTWTQSEAPKLPCVFMQSLRECMPDDVFKPDSVFKRVQKRKID
jgi:AcrR family transcriptional regulator